MKTGNHHKGSTASGTPYDKYRDAITLVALLHHAFQALSRKYASDQIILAPVVVNRSASLIKRLVPDAKRGQLIYGVKFFHPDE